MADVLGLVPAAGVGSRLRPYRAPKELIQVGYHDDAREGGVHDGRSLPKAAIEHTLLALRRGGVRHGLVVISPAKCELLRYLGDGHHLDLSLGYLCQEEPKGMPHALDLASPFVGDRDVCMGMPDTIVRPADCFARLREFHARHRADATLGVFPVADARRLAPVVLEPGTGRVVTVVDKPAVPPVENTWGIVVWSAAFTDLLHAMVAADNRAPGDASADLVLTDVFLAAQREGLRVYGLEFPDGEFHDIGTPDGVMRARRVLEEQRSLPEQVGVLPALARQLP